MSLEKRKSIRKKMFSKGGKIVWASSNEAAKRQFDELIRLRDEYVKAGGTFKKK
jgi:hypothetical protein